MWFNVWHKCLHEKNKQTQNLNHIYSESNRTDLFSNFDEPIPTKCPIVNLLIVVLSLRLKCANWNLYFNRVCFRIDFKILFDENRGVCVCIVQRERDKVYTRIWSSKLCAHSTILVFKMNTLPFPSACDSDGSIQTLSHHKLISIYKIHPLKKPREHKYFNSDI